VSAKDAAAREAERLAREKAAAQAKRK